MSRERPAARPGPSGNVRTVAAALWERLLHNLPQKLGALLLATVFWVFVTTDDAFVAERTLRVPLRTEGLAADESVPGLPESVAVRLSGPSTRLRALELDALDAVLDLRDVTGPFEGSVRVFPPQGITLLSVTPSEVLGTVEVRARKRVPVAVVLLNASPEDTVLEARPSPQQVQVRGPAGELARVSRVLAPYDPAAPAAQAKLYAVDARGVPVPGVTVAPTQVGLVVAPRTVLQTRTLPLRPPPVSRRVSATLVQAEVVVAGPRRVLETLGEVTATLPAETAALGPGQYTLEATLRLPDGVTALSAPQLRVTVRRGVLNKNIYRRRRSFTSSRPQALRRRCDLQGSLLR